MSKNKELAQDYFERHPLSVECHITTDGRVFHSPGTAQGHAASLQDDAVEKFIRDEKKVNDIEVTADDANTPITLKDFDPATTKYDQAKVLFDDLKLEAPSRKKEDIFAALIEAKSKLTE